MATATAKTAYRAGPRSVHTVRLAETTKDNMKRAVTAGQAVNVQTWAEQVIEAALGYVRCHRGNCPDRTPPIPVTFGDFTPMTFGEAAAKAVELAEDQHLTGHGPVFVGAESPRVAVPPRSARTVRFVEPKQAAQ